MTTTSPSVIPRQELAGLNSLRDAPGWIRLISHVALIVLAGLVWRQSGWPLAWRVLGLMLSGMGLATCFAPLHECGHRTVFRQRGLNDAVAWWMGLLSFYNATFYRRYHQWHHRYTHQPGLDPELDDPLPSSWGAYLLEISGIHWWIGKLRGHWRLLFGDLSGLPFMTPELIPQVRRSIRLQFAVYGALALLSCIHWNGFLLWSWLLPLAVGQPLLRWVLLAEHTGCEFSSDGLVNTRTTLTLWPLRWLMWNMPFHAEHHLYPSLPFHALPAAHHWIGPRLQHRDPGYVWVHGQLLQRLSQLGLPT